MKNWMTCALGALLLASGSVVAEVSQDCILTGRVHDTTQEGDQGEVRVTFHNARQGAEAPCNITRGKPKASIRFKANPEDQLHTLSSGSRVKYRYQRKNDQDQWELLSAREI